MGAKLLYYLLLLPLSYLPFSILYLISDFLYLVLYQLVGYRTKVVNTNLKNSFPTKTDAEIKEIEAKFYAHIGDLIVESIKTFSITKAEISKRMVNRNPELINQFYKKGKHVVLVGGHYGNWEMYGVQIKIDIEHHALALFTPLENKFLNEKIKQSRQKFGLFMEPITDIKKRLENEKEKLFAVIFGADQSPRKSQRAYWLNFLNQETGVQFGTEKFAKDYNAAVVYGGIYKVSRGHYEAAYQLISENAEVEPHGFITKKHTELLEKDILNQPEYWLWSHKRWKHKRPEGEKLN